MGEASYFFLHHSNIERDKQTFSIKGQTVNSLNFEDHMFSVTTTQFFIPLKHP